MLYCQPNSFYDEMKFISENNSKFLKKLCLTQYQIDSTIQHIEPISFIIKIALSEPDFYGADKIIALRTFGVNDSLYVHHNHHMMNVYYAIVAEGSLMISKPSFSWIHMKDEVVYFKSTDGHGDEFHYTLDDIAKDEYDDPYAISAYIKYHENIFKPDNLLAKIPTILLKNLA
jgi:hypothetical protein